ncbi:hypothetical protein HCN44_007264 [Aphidius gifuensis]|uniref:U4/U6.U5 tri-snRNP-associated protein 1 n=1 Tax=Aphidius gifuensis TaxID=684658 RepID=A0A835CMZ0_APHGI|nr:U4/U6.U5 tri-snRNP-associated protein 1 [Aphidius gifuensis]KAF7988954.1 hypothetical protein HCN44_007264 [Aphidius gifuensis]
MGSNKRHKNEKTRDIKKKRHRSRSRSYTPEREKNDKHSSSSNSRHHKKHKRKERREYDSDVEIVSAPPPPKISKTSHDPTPPPPEISTKQRSQSPPPSSSSQKNNNNSQASLSIEETNRVRATLGLKPLEVNTTSSKDEPNKLKDDLGEFYHKPAINNAEIQRTEKLKEKLNLTKDKRKIETSLLKIKPLGEHDSDDDINEWVNKSRKLSNEKKKAEERAKILDQLDEEFGINEIVNDDVKLQRKKKYTERNLHGLKVEHNIENFDEGQTVILTLKDKNVLDDDNDVLVNVNMKDDEKYKKNVIIKSKKPGYDAYDDDNYDEYGFSKGNVLDKYDEEIDGVKNDTFCIGIDNAKEIAEKRKNIVKQKLANKKLETLTLPELKLASDYYNTEELEKFKKTKKKKIRKIRQVKTLKADDLIPETDYLRDIGSRRKRNNDDSNKIDNNKVDNNDIIDNADYDIPSMTSNNWIDCKLEDDDEYEIKNAIKNSQKVKKNFKLDLLDITDDLNSENIYINDAINYNNNVNNVNDVNDDKDDKDDKNDQDKKIKYKNITLNSTAEFCRTLGDIPTYGLAGNREEKPTEIMDIKIEKQKVDLPIINGDDNINDERGMWNSVDSDDIKSEPAVAEQAILDAEPSLGQGVGGALKLAMSKGYLQYEDSNRPSASRFAHLQAQNYSIEDKAYDGDDKFGRRDRFNGPTSDFKEKDGFKPNVKLEYIDDDGHVLCPKEAFRYLSHKFHGKGPGKNKVEKRMKKNEQEVLMKRMSSTDTPLGTLNLLQSKQKETQSPFIILSGNKQLQATSISKTKH